MTQPRYQIFVSSTFRDLQDERQAVLNAILKLNQFPAGMEMFPAVDDTAWLHIEKVIEVSDYYVLIIGGKYGSIDSESGLSYTEKEYDFAVSKNIPVLAFTRSDEDSIPVGKSEIDSQIREKLKQFKQKVGNKHHWNYWKNLDELKANVAISLAMSFATNPQKGWVKAGGIEKSELLERLAELQQRYDSLIDEHNKLRESTLFLDTSSFFQSNKKIQIQYKIGDIASETELKYSDIFLALGDKLLIQCEIDDIESLLQRFAFEQLKKSEGFDSEKHSNRSSIIITDNSTTEIETQFLILDLIHVSGLVKQSSGGGFVSSFDVASSSSYTYIKRTWQLTEKGCKYYLSQKALESGVLTP
jgi:Domain of unknown function (DUF4062)